MCVGGVLGARIYGLFQPFYAGDPILADGAWRALRFGSIGGIWGIFLAVSGVAIAMRRTDALTVLDAIVPAVCMSAAIARIACVFQGCCTGVTTGPLAAIVNPVYAWPLLDISALLLTLFAIHVASEKWRISGVQTMVFLGGYGVLRFGAEILRDTYTATSILTWGQLLSIAQVCVAVALAYYLKFHASQRINQHAWSQEAARPRSSSPF